MTTTADPTPDTEAAAPEPTLNDLMARYAGVQAFETEFKKWAAAQRADLEAQMLAARELTGGASKSFEHKFTPKAKVTYSFKGSAEKFIVEDPEAFQKWVEREHPTEVEVKVEVRPSWQKALLDKLLAHDAETGMVVEKATGQEVPGIKYIPASDEPTGFGTSWTGDAKDQALQLVGGGLLAQMLGIEAGDDQ